MRIRELRLIRYGKFTDRALALPGRDRDIHLIVGPNEAGKSTVRAAIGDWLFGIPVRTPLAFLHPMPDLRIGGVLERQAAAGAAPERLAFDRTKGNRNTLRAPDDTPLPEGTLLPWLGSLQAQAFNRMYALDHAALVEGSAGILSASDDLGRMLFQSAAGIEHLGAALHKLQSEADALWAPRKAGARAYYQAQENFEAAQAAFKRATLRARDWKAAHEALATTQAALDAAREQEADLRLQISRLERIRRVRPLLLKLDAATAQRADLLATGPIAPLAADAGSQLRLAVQEIAVARADIARLEHEIAEARDGLDRSPVDSTIVSLTDDITELNERRLQFRAHRTDLIKREEEVRLAWALVQEQMRGLGWQADGEDAVRSRLPAEPARARLSALIRERDAIEQKLDNACASLADRQRQQSSAQEALSRLAADGVDPALRDAVENAHRLGDHEATIAGMREAIADFAARTDAGIAALGAWRMPVQALQGMVVPDAQLLSGLLEQHRTDAAEAKRLRAALDDRAQELARLELELQQFVRRFQPVSRDEVVQARRTRDEAWQAIRQTPQSLADRAGDFEARLAQADRLADERHDRARHDADRQSKADAVEGKRHERLDLEHRLRALDDAMAERTSRWEALASACGLPRLPLEVAATWLQQRQSILQLDGDRADTERALRAAQARADEARDRLRALLGEASADTPVPDLAGCVRQARARITLADEAQGQRARLEQEIREGRLALAGAEAAVELARKAWDAWTGSWRAAVTAAGYAADAAVDQVEAELAMMQDVERHLDHIRNIRSERIETMLADLDGLARTARELAQRLAVPHADLTPEALALELVRRLDLARKADAERAAWQERLDRDRTKLEAAEQRLLSVRARLSPLMMAAGADDEAALGVAIERSDRLRAIEGAMASAEHDLALAADGLPVQTLRAEVEGIGPDALAAEIAQLDARSREVVDLIASLGNDYGANKVAFDALNGTDEAARAESQRQEAIAAMADAAERYLRLQTAARLLRWSIEKFRETRQGPMLQKASAIFSALTLDSFSRLLVDADGETPRLLGLRPDGRQVDVGGMSEGSRDQLYLALRLAALELQSEEGAGMPLIADDLFVNFDDRRTGAGLNALGELSRRMQVVFLTHHDHLVPLARQVLGEDLNVVVL